MRLLIALILLLLLTAADTAGNLLINPDFEQCANGLIGWQLENAVQGDDACIGGNNGHNGSAWAYRLKQADVPKRLSQVVTVTGQARDSLRFSCYLNTWATPFQLKQVNLRLALYEHGALVGNRVIPAVLVDSQWTQTSAVLLAKQKYDTIVVTVKVKPVVLDQGLGAFILVDDCSLIRIPSPGGEGDPCPPDCPPTMPPP